MCRRASVIPAFFTLFSLILLPFILTAKRSVFFPSGHMFFEGARGKEDCKGLLLFALTF